jgi:uncharacterized repeat protein (TIGR01451 family)
MKGVLHNMIYKKRSVKIVYMVILTMLMQVFIPMFLNYNFAEGGNDLGNIFTFNSLKLGDKESGTEISGDSVIDVSGDTNVYLEYSWDTLGLTVESLDYSEIEVPDAFKLDVNFPESDIVVSDDSGNDVVVGTYTLIDGILKFVFNENIETYEEVDEGYVGFGLEFDLQVFEENVIQEIEFNDTENKTLKVTVVPSQTITGIEKEGIPDADKDPKTITWTVKVINIEETTINNPLVWDFIPEGLSLDETSIDIYDLNVGYNGDTSVGNAVNTGYIIRTGVDITTVDASVEIEFDSMDPYKGYRIEYTTIIEDYSKTSFSNEAHLGYDSKNLDAVATISNIQRSDFIEKDVNKLGNGQIQWSIDVNKPGGSISQAIIKDTLPAGLSIDGDIEIYTLNKNGDIWNESTSYTTAGAFDIDLGQLGPDDVYRIKFTTDIDYSQVNGGIYQKTNGFENTVELYDGETFFGDANKTVIINRDPILRKVGTSNVTYENKILTWTIHINEANHPINSAVVKDTVPEGLNITESDIKVFDASGSDITSQATISVAGNLITVTLGDIGTEYRKIVYTTEIESDSFDVNSFSNSAGLTGTGVGTDGNTSDDSVNPPSNIFRKNYISIDYNNRTMNWEIRVNPRREAINTLKITDTFPNNGLILLPETLLVKLGGTELTKDTDYTLIPNTSEGESGYHKGFIVEFLNPSLPLNDIISVTYQTSFDSEVEVGGNTLIENADENQEYINRALFEGTTINGNTIDTTKNASKVVISTSWNGGKKEGKLISIDSEENSVDGWKSGNERKIQWEVYINYLEEELGTGVVIEDILDYSGQIDLDSVGIYEYTVNTDGTTSINLDKEIDSSNYNAILDQDGKLTVNFGTFDVNKRYVLVFTTSVPYVSENTYTNQSKLIVGTEEYPYTSSKSFDNYDKLLSKEALGVSNDKVFTDQEVDWDITINESLSIIEKAQIVDTISTGMIYKNDSLKVYKLVGADRVLLSEGATEDYTLSVDTSGINTILSLTFINPIVEYTYEIEYTTLVIAETGNVNNSVDFSGTNITNETKESQQLSAAKFSWVGGQSASSSKGTIKLTKIDEEGNKITSGSADFYFGYIFNGDYYQIGEDVFTTDNGVLEIDIPNLDRTYYFEEANSPKGYLKADPVTKVEIYADPDDVDKIYELEIENTQIKADIKFNKVDEWEDQPIQGAEFALYDESNSQISTALSDQNGEVVFEDVPYGDYTIKEITPAEGYLLNTEVLEATVGDNDDGSTIYAKPNGETTEGIYSMENTIKKGNLIITKVDQSDTDKKLSGAEFSIFKLEGETEVYVETITTDENGIAELNDIRYGDYLVKESKAPSRYYLNTEGQTFQIVDDKDSISLTFENKKKPSGGTGTTGSITITKTDSVDEEILLEGAVFEIRDSDDKVVRIIATDSNGEALADDLSLGKYTVIETSPPQGYKIDETQHEVFLGYTIDMRMQITNEKNDEIIPEEPVDPEDPEDPEEPVDPEDPEEPLDPEDPIDSEEPEGEGSVVYEPEDPENEIIELVDPPKNGEVSIEDGKVTYTPDETYDGEDEITIKVTKEDGTEEIITIEINEDLVPLDDLVELPDLGVETNRPLYFIIAIISALGLVLTRKKFLA